MMPGFPWIRLLLLAFWCVLLGIFLGEFLPLPPVPRGITFYLLILVLLVGTGRAILAVRSAVSAAVTAAARRGTPTA